MYWVTLNVKIIKKIKCSQPSYIYPLMFLHVSKMNKTEDSMCRIRHKGGKKCLVGADYFESADLPHQKKSYAFVHY